MMKLNLDLKATAIQKTSPLNARSLTMLLMMKRQRMLFVLMSMSWSVCPLKVYGRQIYDLSFKNH